jgi:hypothetical protein
MYLSSGFGFRLPRLTGPLGVVRAGVGREKHGPGTKDGPRHFLVGSPEAAPLVGKAIYRRGSDLFGLLREPREGSSLLACSGGILRGTASGEAQIAQLSIAYATDEIPLESRESIPNECLQH